VELLNAGNDRPALNRLTAHNFQLVNLGIVEKYAAGLQRIEDRFEQVIDVARPSVWRIGQNLDPQPR
jgi:hypothetical protein